MGENSSRRHAKLFNWILNNLTLCCLCEKIEKLSALATFAKCLVAQFFKTCIFNPAVLGRSPGVTGITFDPVGFFAF